MQDLREHAKAQQSESNGDVHRLRDIVVEEVSLVDRAANKRRFLIVKRSDGMSRDEKPGDSQADGVEKATKQTSPEAEERRRKPGVPCAVEESTKARRRAADEEQEEAEKANGASAASNEDEEDEEDEAKSKRSKANGLVLPAAAKQALLAGLAKALERLTALAARVKEATAPESGEQATLPDEVTVELDAIGELLGEVGKRAGKRTAKADVAKGARMAKDRLDRFQKAMSLLADILKELTDSKDTPVAPTAGSAETGVRKREEEAAPPPVPGLEQLVAGIGELTRVVKHQEEELARVRQAHGVSNAIPVEGGRRAEPQDVSWPLDMNRPVSRDKVRKEVSFYDE